MRGTDGFSCTQVLERSSTTRHSAQSSELDAEALAAAWEAGRALDLEEAVALGLGEA
jgi:hypothetical protein